MSTAQIKNGYQGGSDDQLKVNSDGSINVNTTGGGGAITANQGTPNTTANAWPVEVVASGAVVTSTAYGGKQGLDVNVINSSGSTVTQGTTPWVDNISQFGGNNIVTGIGGSGIGIPRVTVSNDSNILATQSGVWTVQQGSAPWSVSQSGGWDVTQFGGTNISTGIGASGSGIPRITIANDSNLSVTGSGSITTNGGSIVVTTNGATTIDFQITGIYTGAIVVQGSVDGSTFITLPPQQGIYLATGVQATSLSASTGNLVINISGLYQVKIVSAFFSGTANISWVLTNSLLSTYVANNALTPLFISHVDGQKATYTACYAGLIPATSATDIFTLTGSSTKTVRVIYISVSAVKTTAGPVPLYLIKRSTANSGASVTAVTLAHDSDDGPNTATAVGYSANPTLGALAGYSEVMSQPVNPQSTTDSNTFMPFTYGYRAGERAIVLRGTSQCFSINLNGTTVTGGSYNITMRWTEE